ncbi:hypothetical protein [Nocardioides marmoribigeumensis]|uniref:Uncharacterized protein n=1 Tax=Nocardioides marmoribigeumensis TaxID=433649 RepID=A0ABU2BTC2_9ACTN|nr:hypothetical protein [Nocardioides marmoribigeumensis]MDR7361872.1 hypothetical protein [Nocardioides marmoribigeumensis]
MASAYASLSREQLATLVPELLLGGHLIDRAGMAWCIAEWGREEMAQVAVEEWSGASPVYTRRMQRALGFSGDDVVTIFKGLQLDIGAPPQFMDFRFTVHDPRHGEFRLDHCGALMDVEPMGEDYVRSMCHDIEDPTFDATAVATDPRAQVRPVHRPPRVPADRSPHCAWTVVIDESHPEVHPSDDCLALSGSAAALVMLDPVDPLSPGRSSYDGPLLADLDLAAFSHSALVRIADEVVLQWHLLALSFIRAVRRRGDDATVRRLASKQLIGIAGLTASRLADALGLPRTPDAALEVLRLNPLLNPVAYVGTVASRDALRVGGGPAGEDDGWLRLVGPGATRALEAVVQAVDPTCSVEVGGDPADWTVRVTTGHEPAPEPEEVAVTRLSTGAGFVFRPRRSLPIRPIAQEAP